MQASLAQTQRFGVGRSSGRSSRGSRLVTAARPPPRQFRTIREDIDKKRIEKKLGTQDSQPAAPTRRAPSEEGGPNMAVAAVLAVLLPAIAFILFSQQ